MFPLLILSFGLAMDALAVSLIRGSVGDRSILRATELGLAFGLAQGLMPLLGWSLAEIFTGPFQILDHWIAFTILAVLGGRMLIEASRSGDEPKAEPRFHLLGLATAAIATSIDAGAAGITLSLLHVSVPVACLVIGTTTAILCMAGYLVGSHVPDRMGKLAELFGGLVLIALGVKILMEHLAH